MPTEFVLRRLVQAPPDDVWDVVTDLGAHGRYVPLTTVTMPDPVAVGSTVHALTRLGPLVLDDAMLVRQWRPPAPGCPGSARLLKTGFLSGHADILVVGRPSGTLLTWRETLALRVPGTQAVSRRVFARAGSVVFGRVVDRLLADAGMDAEVLSGR